MSGALTAHASGMQTLLNLSAIGTCNIYLMLIILSQAGAIAPLVELLRNASTGEVAAELAAVVLRNLALGNAGNRDAIVDAHGLAPLLGLLSAGQEWLTRPMPCEVGFAPHLSHIFTTQLAYHKAAAGHSCPGLHLLSALPCTRPQEQEHHVPGELSLFGMAPVDVLHSQLGFKGSPQTDARACCGGADGVWGCKGGHERPAQGRHGPVLL